MSSPQNHSYFPPQPGPRSRSSSTADRYRPRTYSDAPPNQPQPHLLGPHQSPYLPAGTPLHAEPPYPVELPMSSPHMPMPVAPQRPSATEVHFRRDSGSLYQDVLRRPSYSGSAQDRRPSHDSKRSHRSHHSYHSHHDHMRPEDEELYDEEEDGEVAEEPKHKHKHNHRERSASEDLAAYRQRQKDKGENVSRSLGDSLLSVLHPLKYLFEPRDKY